ncbi:MAG: zf-HC2 domain-containing protein [Ornithinimicrobium sp.]|uniref:zf-HC2 domain-containing protein n=1 Tax=Ornithinimicrobium sp. TaxID=1977084 RepID=UPI0026DECEF7|nr:zf-HC2 domain-containing protein [Ornithinimicrobium sp.]MDO5740207.1 zf-HC2 domain-containing protein [Ornithinimicrobium sp.]
MSGAVRQMLTCYWSAKRIQRYLDVDPSAPLTPGEVTRLEEHLATCERCGELMRQHRFLHTALSLWSAGSPVDPASVDRMRTVLDDLIEKKRS